MEDIEKSILENVRAVKPQSVKLSQSVVSSQSKITEKIEDKLSLQTQVSAIRFCYSVIHIFLFPQETTSLPQWSSDDITRAIIENKS